MASRKFFVGGNWKCNGTSDSVKKIVIVLNEAEVPSEDVVEVVVSPPFVFLAQVKGLLRPDFAVAAQIFWVRKGGDFTVEIRCHGSFWVTLNGGHCWVNQMICTYALSQGLKVIACIGETLEQRESGPTMEVISAQTKAIAGSVNGGNCKELAAQPDVDGFLVGGASLKPEFVDIIKSATVKSTSA